MTRFYLIRHGEPDWPFKDERKLQGALRDFVPLTDLGVKQAEQVITNHKYLADCDMIISSPYTRALQTAAVINRNIGLPIQVVGLPIQVEFDIHEWTPDNWHATTVGEITELWTDYMNHKGIYPKGETRIWESKESVVKRVSNVLNKYLDKSKVMVVCHGMVIATLIEANSEEVQMCGVYEYEIS